MPAWSIGPGIRPWKGSRAEDLEAKSHALLQDIAPARGYASRSLRNEHTRRQNRQYPYPMHTHYSLFMYYTIAMLVMIMIMAFTLFA